METGIETGMETGIEKWSPLPYDEWRATLDTLHMYCQIVGKLRLALSPFEPQWANVALYVSTRGLTTSPMPARGGTFDAEFDFLDDRLVLHTSDGAVESIALGPKDVADFYGEVRAALERLGVEASFTPVPCEVPDPIPFPEDRTHHTYDADAVRRFFAVLVQVDVVMKSYRARFRGRTSPVHFFWGSFDLANTRFSGRPADPPPGSGTIMRYSADAEQIAAGFWPGDARYPRAGFFSYAYPRPSGIENMSIRPADAEWNEEIGEFVLPYDSIRSAASPGAAIRDFLDTTYAAGAQLLGWSRDLIGEGP